MLEQELHWERGLFFALNGSDSVFWDQFFWLYSSKWTWIPFYLCFLFVFIYKKHWKEILCILLAVTLVILIGDQLVSGFFKPFFHRFRPTHHPDFYEQVRTVFDYRGGKYGFISGHAANSFAFATFTSLLFRSRWFTGTILLFAVLNAYSRIYLGVHFISDVAAGTLVGILVGYGIYLLYAFARQKWIFNDCSESERPSYSKQEIRFLCMAYFVMLAILLLFNNQLVGLFH
ncbi:MAG: phosphatase PAP2 family protein [Dysgonamonadaceae bacterium]|jgi:undecaprenyl-diphosphatase|nr:phosphatase PAP2 family protein [Dysgonamonadaceae bacterium]